MKIIKNPTEERLEKIRLERVAVNSDDAFVFEQLDMYRKLHKIYVDRYANLVGELNSGTASDGYHTFNELYNHRMILFAVICKQNRAFAWKSLLHEDGTMYDDYFIVGLTTPEGHYSYHYHVEHWDLFEATVMERAPKWDGHLPSDLKRLLSLVDTENYSPEAKNNVNT